MITLILILLCAIMLIFLYKKYKSIPNIQRNADETKIYNIVNNNVDYDKDFKMSIILYPIILICLLFAFVLYILYVSNPINGIVVDKPYYIIPLIPCLVLVFIVAYKKRKNHYIYGRYKDVLSTMYTDTKIVSECFSELVCGNGYNVGSVKHDYDFHFAVQKYDCLVSHYYEKRLEIYSTVSDNHSDSKFWAEENSVLKYCYNNYDKNYHNESFNKKTALAERGRFILNIAVENNQLIITKKIASNPTNEQILDDVNDIKYFYELFFKK